MLDARRYRTAVLLFLTGFCAGNAAADDWPHFMGPDRTGVSREAGLTLWSKEGPKLAWQRNVGQGYAAVSVVGGRVYTMGNDGKNDVAYCLDPKTGEPVWTYGHPCKGGGNGYAGARTPPTVAGGRVYTLSLKGLVHCLDAKTGKPIWTVDAPRQLKARGGRHGFSCHPLVVDDLVIVELGAAKGDLAAFDAKTGKVRWQSGSFTCGHSSPTLATLGGKRTLIQWTGSALAGFDPKTGRVLWQYPTSINWNCNIPIPLVFDGKVYISSVYYKKVGSAMIEPGRSPKPAWTQSNLQQHCASAVLHEGRIYGVHGWVNERRAGKGAIRCLDAKTGKVLWTHVDKDVGVGSTLLADGKLFILGGRGLLVVAEARDDGYKELARAKVLDGRCWNMPVLADGRLYVRDFEGTLKCFDLRAAKR